ncbi:MAG: nickel-binding protein [Dehalococcoidia bacterium]
MPLYMDIHPDLAGATPAEVQAAHERDLGVQDKYGVRFLTYWFNDREGRAFCLVEAPDTGTALAVHREAHGLMPGNIIEVDTPAVEQFLGNYRDFVPDAARLDGKNDPGVRGIMFTDMKDSVAQNVRIGDDAALEVVRIHNQIVRARLGTHGGRQVKHTGDGIMASFTSVSRAVECTMTIQRAIDEHNVQNAEVAILLKIGLSAGEPVEDSDDLFGVSVSLSARMCAHATAGQILIASVVRDLCIGKKFAFNDLGQIPFKGFSDPVHVYEVNWQSAPV